MTEKLIRLCEEKCLKGEVLSRDEIIALLEIPVGSPEDQKLREAARRAASLIALDKGYLWCAIGMDYAPCAMNCKFCSFGEKWELIEQSRQVTEEEIFNRVRGYVAEGAAYIVLRTTEFYNLDTLLKQIPRIRKEIPGNYGIILNTGELDFVTANRVAAADVYGVYHALRLREGTDTPFSPQKRIYTMNSVTSTQMSLISLVEPLGPEHSAQEIADCFLNAVSCGAKICGAMARFPVKGTPLGDDTSMVDEAYLAHVIAVLRLSGGNNVRDICAHPASQEAVNSGANVVVVESGAIPRDAGFSEKDWAGTDMQHARKLLEKAGYHISVPPAQNTKRQKCACQGGNLEKFMQPIILDILSRGDQTGYAVQKQMREYATYQQAIPDMAATYRFLKIMRQRGLVHYDGTAYAITNAGLHCLDDWKETLKEYISTLTCLIGQLEISPDV